MTLLDKVTSLNRSRFIEISICAAKDVNFSCYGGRYVVTWFVANFDHRTLHTAFFNPCSSG